MFKKALIILFCASIIGIQSSAAPNPAKVDEQTIPSSVEAGEAHKEEDGNTLNSWEKTFPLEQKKEGKYNIVVTAEDQAGNTTVAGPYNIYIDSESDKPVVGITNPSEGMRVPGNLNIVGTCTDDDGVDVVYIIFDDGPYKGIPQPANGREFWSYELNTTEWLEGPHTIEVYGIDKSAPIDEAWEKDKKILMGPPYNFSEEKIKEIEDKRIKAKEALASEDLAKLNEEYEKNGKIKNPLISDRGDSVKVTWQLDRRTPEIHVMNPAEMGSMKSGRFKIEGYVTDGNGIQSLEYSCNEEKKFADLEAADLKEVKLEKSKYFQGEERKAEYESLKAQGISVVYEFSITVDSRQLEEGARKCLLKARDGAGSVGRLTYLFLVKNNPPKIEILTPQEKEAQNGIFSVAGYALGSYKKEKIKDGEETKEVEKREVNGIKKLEWSFGDLSGAFYARDDFKEEYKDVDDNHSLIPGNPYWSVELDTRKINKKSETFQITATDIMGNTVTEKRTILLDQEADKPLVSIKYPVENEGVDGEDGLLFIRGIAEDDDGVVKVIYSLDGKDESTVECNGVFYTQIPGALSDGTHTLTAYAVDKYGVKGNETSVSFQSKGIAPTYSGAKYLSGKSSQEFTDGMKINPEENGSYEIKVNSSCGLKAVNWELSWGSNGSIKKDLTVGENAKSATVSIPLGGDDIPWGFSKVTVRATDIYDRESLHYAILNITDLTQINVEKPGVYFTDSIVAENGAVKINPDYPLTGYFAGGKISSVATVPAVRGVSAAFDGNVITVTAAPGASSAKFKVRVTTDIWTNYDSQEMYFYSDEKAPVITIDSTSKYDTENGRAFEFLTQSDKLSISGGVTADSDVSISYRIFSAKVQIDDSGFISVISNPETSELTKVDLNRRGKFSITNLTTDKEFASDGMYVVELVAESASGKKSAEAVFVRKIPYPPAAGGDKKSSKKDPKLFWLKGENYYGICVYQGECDNLFKVVKADEIKADTGSLKFEVKATDAEVKGKAPSYTESLSVSAPVEIDAHFAEIDGAPYKSGMSIVLEKGTNAEAGHKGLIKINSNAAVTGVTYSFNGGSEKSAAILPGSTGPEYSAEFPLANLPAKINSLKAVVTTAGGTKKEITGTIIVLRTHAVLNNAAKIFWSETDGVTLSGTSYVLNDGAALKAFANIPFQNIKASVRGDVRGLTAEAGPNNTVLFKATSDGTYRGVSIRVTDEAGGAYNSPEVTLVVDTSKPTITLNRPKDMAFVQKSFRVSGSVTDGNGVSSLEYTLSDNADAEWKPVSIPKGGGEFSFTVDLSDIPDGYAGLSLRAKDTSGKIAYCNTVVQKDTTAPQVQVILPDAASTSVNGENTIGFLVKEAGLLKSITYRSPGGARSEEFEIYAHPEDIPAKTLTDSEGKEVPVADRNNPLKTLNSSLPHMEVGTAAFPIDNRMSFVFTDAAGNSTVIPDSSYSWEFKVNSESDKPVVEINLPEENQVLTTDFKISGVVSDDDGPSRVYYRIDSGRYQLVSSDPSLAETDDANLRYNYEIEVPLSSMTDNEHSVSVYSVDRNGIRGSEDVRKFRISLEEPKGWMNEPDISKTVKGIVTLRGTASDKNGISKVQVSIDNGASYNDAEGTTNWSYTFDTRVIQDGTHVVFFKVYDGYGITGLYSSLINIDNTAPELRLELPLDDSKTSKNLFFSGQTTDNIGLTELYITVRSLEGKTVPSRLAHYELTPSEIISEIIDIERSLNDGFYNVELTGKDAAGNVTRVSRNIQLDSKTQLARAELLYPLNGEHLNGEFNIYGITSSEEDDPVQYVEISLKDGSGQLNSDNRIIAAAEHLPYGKNVTKNTSMLTPNGYFKFRICPVYKLYDKEGNVLKDEEGKDKTVSLTAGVYRYKVISHTKNGKVIESREQTFVYAPNGPWVTLDNADFTYGDFAQNRPLLAGNAGYILTEEEKAELKDKKNISVERRRELEGKKIKGVYVSFDNGKSYKAVSRKNRGNWSYRIENLDIAAGTHFMLVKAEMYNGENAITRTIVQIDRTAPVIKLISPGEGGHYNQQLNFKGLTSDDVNLKSVKFELRKGDKAAYEVPAFIQGLYFDVSVWGATLYNVGIGLTAFDNAVKIQANFGQFTQSQRDMVSDMLGQSHTDLRFGGNVIGAKIIAQIGYIPFRYFFGRDWDWLSASISVGANFSYFTDSGATSTDGEKVSQVLSAALVQIEFPRVTIPNAKLFKTWSLYTEPQIWFIPSDIASDDAKKEVFTVSLGIRTSVF
ncbi:Ig-like domain-containing protein [Treponema sp.]|uniref:Ig-like domain-containing protein n=1 Tax=Treponema sp. TaxID=166 RepID=UPI0025F0DE26|nr:Ig-like domain-containing protein [Treponema sp.]MCR5218020.1 Ig-like domain repeat protein [Treponema sp.]